MYISQYGMPVPNIIKYREARQTLTVFLDWTLHNLTHSEAFLSHVSLPKQIVVPRQSTGCITYKMKKEKKQEPQEMRLKISRPAKDKNASKPEHHVDENI